MPLALLAIVLAATTPVPTTSGALRASCLAGIAGDDASAAACSAYVDAVASTLETTAPTACMVQEPWAASTAVWAYMDWAATNREDPAADAAPGVATALLGRWPCGWTRG